MTELERLDFIQAQQRIERLENVIETLIVWLTDRRLGNDAVLDKLLMHVLTDDPTAKV
jgi:hypothetical protein